MSSPAQQALDIATALQQGMAQGQVDPTSKNFHETLLGAVMLLAEGVLGTTPSSEIIGDGTITTDVSTTTPVDTPSTN